MKRASALTASLLKRCIVPSLIAPLAMVTALAGTTSAEDRKPIPSVGLYRLPFADGTRVKVFDDFLTHLAHGPRGPVCHRRYGALIG